MKETDTNRISFVKQSEDIQNSASDPSKEEHSLYASLLNETNQAIVVTELDSHTILFANQKAAEIGKTTVENAIGKHCYECLNKCSEINEKCMAEIPEEGLELYEERSGKTYRVKRKRINWKGTEAAVCYIADRPELEIDVKGVVAKPTISTEIRETDLYLAKAVKEQSPVRQLGNWKNIFQVIKAKRGELKTLLTDEMTRIRLQFILVYIVLGTVSAGMTLLNALTGWKVLGLQTAVFAVCCLVDVMLALFSSRAEHLSRILFGFEIIVLCTSFAIVGEPDGFSVLWAVLLPTSGLLLYRAKWGSVVVAVQWLLLVLLFWTKPGNSLLQYSYGQTFLTRYPVLFGAFFAIGFVFEFIRNVTQTELIKMRMKFEYMYNHDALTGLFNRYGFNQSVKKMEESEAGEEPAFAICDLDGFKQVNDKYGHMNGDIVLKETGRMIEETVGDKGIPCRWGGEEFSVLFYRQEDAIPVCEEILKKCREKEYRFGEYHVHETISIGLVMSDCFTPENSSEIITAADANLYRAKTTGKNRIVSSELKFKTEET